MIQDILGLGCDILEVNRIERLLHKGSEAFIKRILTAEEIFEYDRRAGKSAQRGILYLASRFCAKEAFSKAMGTGVGVHFSFQDLSVLNENSGAPALFFSKQLSLWLQSKNALSMISGNKVMMSILMCMNF